MPKKNSPLFLAGNRWLLAYLAFLSAFAPLATDMYLPALPIMAQALNTDDTLVSYTLSVFLLVFAVSMLAWGPLSDKYGRKPVLAIGSIVFIISSVAIALSDNIWSLFFWRILQAAGSGSASAMSLAIVKDIMRGSLMEKVVGSMQAATILAPMLAPVIGGSLLYLINWRGIFWCLSLCGVIALLGCFAIRETCSTKSLNSTLATFKRFAKVLSIPKFRHYLLIFSAMAMPFMSYLAVSSFIFQNNFSLSAQIYSLFFAFNAFCSLLGPLAHIYVLRRYRQSMVITCHLLIMFIMGILLLIFGRLGPWHFALLFAPISFCGSAMRPPATVLMLESIQGDNGIVASLINCGGLAFGSLSMILATLPFWPNSVAAVGCIAACVSGACFLAWNFISREVLWLHTNPR